MIKENKAVFY